MVKRCLPLILLAAAVTCAVIWWAHVRNELFVLVGNRAEGAGYYGFWSGLGGALQVFTLAFGGMALYWHHACHVSTCVRPGRHVVDGTRWCSRHHLAARKQLAETGSAHDLTGSGT